MASILTESAFQAFYNGLTRIEKGEGLVTPAQLNSKNLMGRLSEEGANSDFTFPENYGTPTFASYLTTAPCTIHQLVLSFTVSDVDETAPQDGNLWLGGTAALNPGIIWGVGTSGTATPATYASSAATTIESFALLWGADVNRYPGPYLNATNNLNSDNLIVTLDFKKRWGHPLLLGTGVYIGVYLAEDFSGATKCTTFGGTVFGKLV
jgi:hypothetical protein